MIEPPKIDMSILSLSLSVLCLFALSLSLSFSLILSYPLCASVSLGQNMQEALSGHINLAHLLANKSRIWCHSTLKIELPENACKQCYCKLLNNSRMYGSPTHRGFRMILKQDPYVRPCSP